MKTKNLFQPQLATASLHKLQSEMSKALTELFGEDEKIQVQKHLLGDEVVLVFMSGNICATFHVQATPSAVQKGVAV